MKDYMENPDRDNLKKPSKILAIVIGSLTLAILFVIIATEVK
jgi:hypothetical protein